MFRCPASRGPFVGLLSLLLLPALLHAHGGVVEEDDLCVINVGYMKAHFKIYVPQRTAHTEYCEDIPVRGESVFVMQYLHDGLSTTALGFRIIRNVTGKGTFARLEDIAAIDDIDAVTVRYEPPGVVADVYTLLHAFDEDGEYIGIVTAAKNNSADVYTAVFPFEVGYTGLGIWPWIVAAVIFLQLNYWLMSRRRTAQAAAAAILAVMIAAPGSVAEELSYDSDNGHFRVRYTSDIEPIEINRIHSWTLYVESGDGRAVDGASITISGGMPQHDHGLPTAPRVAAECGAGCYRIDGMRFHMPGLWEVQVSIEAGGRRDAVTIPLSL